MNGPDSPAAPWCARRVGDGVYEVLVDASWYQGRGAFGGLVAAAAAEAMTQTVGDAARPLRTLTLQCCAPVAAGEVLVRTEVLRAGNRVTYASARFEQAGAVVAFATGSFARERPNALQYLHAQMPASPPLAALPPMPSDVPGLPTFAQHVELRFGVGALPFSSAPEAAMGAWVKLRDSRPVDAPHAIALLDALPPAFFAMLEGPRPAASVDFSITLLAEFPEGGFPADEPMLVWERSQWAGDGYAEEARELWSTRGELIGVYRQLLAVLG